MKLHGIEWKSLLVVIAAMAPAGLVSTLRAESSPAATTLAKPMPADEVPGPRPYEMVWADRKPPHAPLADFDSLEGWRIECRDGAIADLFSSQRQRVWESPVARLVYRGTSKSSTVVLRPPAPTPAQADCPSPPVRRPSCPTI